MPCTRVNIQQYGDELSPLTRTINIGLDWSMTPQALAAALEEAEHKEYKVALTWWPYHHELFSRHDPREHQKPEYWQGRDSWGERWQQYAEVVARYRVVARVHMICEWFNDGENRAVRLGIPAFEYDRAVVDALEFANSFIVAALGGNYDLPRWYGMGWRTFFAGPNNIVQRVSSREYVPTIRGQASRFSWVIDRPQLMDLSLASYGAMIAGRQDGVAWMWLANSKRWVSDTKQEDVAGDYGLANVTWAAQVLASMRNITDIVFYPWPDLSPGSIWRRDFDAFLRAFYSARTIR